MYLPQEQGTVSAGSFFCRRWLQTGQFLCHIFIPINPSKAGTSKMSLGRRHSARSEWWRTSVNRFSEHWQLAETEKESRQAGLGLATCLKPALIRCGVRSFAKY